jgi:hypothetical protein
MGGVRVRFDPSLTAAPAAPTVQVKAGGVDRNRGGAEQLRRYWTRGEGGAKIRWGTGGDFTRCVEHLTEHLGARAKGYCALRHKEMNGMWPGDARNKGLPFGIVDATFLGALDPVDAVEVGRKSLLGRVQVKARDGDGDGWVDDSKPSRRWVGKPTGDGKPDLGRKPSATAGRGKPRSTGKPDDRNDDKPWRNTPKPSGGYQRGGDREDPKDRARRRADRINNDLPRGDANLFDDDIPADDWEPPKPPPIPDPLPGAGTKKGRQAPMTDDEAAERLSRVSRLMNDDEWKSHGPHDSMAQHTRRATLSNGSKVVVWSDQRRALHRQMIDDEIQAAIDRGVPADRKGVILAGLTGAGKSSILKANAKQWGIELDAEGNADRPLNYLVVNPDLFKERLIAGGHVDVMPGTTPWESAHLAHEESSYLADMLHRAAEARGLNTVVDGTLGAAIAIRRATALADAGYTLRGVFVDVSVDKSLASSAARYRAGVDRYEVEGEGMGGRAVPDWFVTGSKPHSGLPQVPDGKGGWTDALSVNRTLFHDLDGLGVFADGAHVYDNEGDGSTTDYPGAVVWERGPGVDPVAAPPRPKPEPRPFVQRPPQTPKDEDSAPRADRKA